MPTGDPALDAAATSGKWIELAPETPLREAMCEVLRARSLAVLERISPVVERAEEDIEHVHDLRVATRRLAAAVRIVKTIDARLACRKLGKTLRQLRRLCGEARDLDVRQQFLCNVAERSPEAAGLTFVIARGNRRRADLQEELERELPDLEGQVRERSERLVAAMWTALAAPQEGTPATFAEAGRAALQRELERLRLAAAGWAETSPAEAPTQDLHQLRIACKKFRYAAEVFSAAMPFAFREELYPRLQDVQSVLGDLQDAASASQCLFKERRDGEERLLTWLGLDSGQGAEARELQTGLEAALRAYADLAAKARKQLRQTWPGFIRADFLEPLEAMLHPSGP
jgi:CHAD domain-containing protein